MVNQRNYFEGCVKPMCVKCCECNNCYKTKTCIDCEHAKYVEKFLNINCNKNGVQGCPFKLVCKYQGVD